MDGNFGEENQDLRKMGVGKNFKHPFLCLLSGIIFMNN